MENKFEKCIICKDYHYSNRTCNPIFYFKHDAWGEDFIQIRAFDFEDAAEKWGELYNEDEGSLMNDSAEVIISDGREEKRFKVSAELSVNYFVDEI